MGTCFLTYETRNLISLSAKWAEQDAENQEIWSRATVSISASVSPLPEPLYGANAGSFKLLVGSDRTRDLITEQPKGQRQLWHHSFLPNVC